MTNETDRHEDSEEQRLLEAIRAEREALPAEIRDRLGAMRRAAVAEAGSTEGRWRFAPGTLRPSGSMLAFAAAAFCITLAVIMALLPRHEAMLPMVAEPDVTMIQDLELYEELEFLAWLEEESQGAG